MIFAWKKNNYCVNATVENKNNGDQPVKEEEE
jgi:hypothetical protein